MTTVVTPQRHRGRALRCVHFAWQDLGTIPWPPKLNSFAHTTLYVGKFKEDNKENRKEDASAFATGRALGMWDLSRVLGSHPRGHRNTGGQLSWLHRIYDVRTLEERKSQAWQQIPAILAPRGGSRKIRSLRVSWATQKLPGQPEHGKTGLGHSLSVEHLPSTPQALRSSPSTRRKRQENMLCSPQATSTSPVVTLW